MQLENRRALYVETETGPRADLIRAKALIADPKRWCQGGPRSEDGQQICAGVALGIALGDGIYVSDNDPRGGTLLKKAAKQLGYFGVPSLNDTADHATVMRMFDLAIELDSQ